MNFQKNLKRRLKVKTGTSMKGMGPKSAGGFKKSLKLKGKAKGMSFGKTSGY